MDKADILYEAGCEALVSDKSAENTFEKMISCAFSHGDVGTFDKHLKRAEEAIRMDFEVSSMPGPWRSAKSVIKNAMRLGIALVDDNGKFLGKTALQNAIKEKKTEKEEISLHDYVNQIMKMIWVGPSHLSETDIENQVVARINLRKPSF